MTIESTALEAMSRVMLEDELLLVRCERDIAIETLCDALAMSAFLRELIRTWVATSKATRLERELGALKDDLARYAADRVAS